MRTFLFGILAAVVVSMVAGQELNPRETMSVGIDLTLGMSEDAVIKNLTEVGYKVRKGPLSNGFKEKGFTSVWFVDEAGLLNHAMRSRLCLAVVLNLSDSPAYDGTSNLCAAILR